MCLSPTISLATALIEWLVVIILFLRYKKSPFRKYVVIFLIILGLYQFSEFMLCSTQNSFWARFGFIVYTFLPAIGLHFALFFTKKKLHHLTVYALPFIFSLIALFYSDFVFFFSCETYFVTAITLFFDPVSNLILFLIYWTYYAGYLIFISVLFGHHLKIEKNIARKRIKQLVLLGVLISAAPALIFIIFLPSLGIQFPSIYCQFAVIFAIIALVGAEYEKRHRL